jgi:type II secretory pathway pseudopilin PulG
LLIVLAIMGIGAAIAIPRYGASIARFRAESAARRVEADLKYAQAAANAASASRTVAFNPGAASYAIGGVRELNNKGGVYTVSLAELHGVQIGVAEFGGDTTVVFDGYGRPDSAGVVRVRYGGDGWEVTLDALGATRVARTP